MMDNMKLAFYLTEQEYRMRAYLGESPDATVTIHKGEVLYAEFKYPSYKIFNLAAHFRDIVSGIKNNNPQSGFYLAGSDGLGGCVMPIN